MTSIEEMTKKITVNKDRLINVRKDIGKLNGYEFQVRMLQQVEGFLSYLEKEFKAMGRIQ